MVPHPWCCSCGSATLVPRPWLRTPGSASLVPHLWFRISGSASLVPRLWSAPRDLLPNVELTHRHAHHDGVSCPARTVRSTFGKRNHRPASQDKSESCHPGFHTPLPHAPVHTPDSTPPVLHSWFRAPGSAPRDLLPTVEQIATTRPYPRRVTTHARHSFDIW